MRTTTQNVFWASVRIPVNIFSTYELCVQKPVLCSSRGSITFVLILVHDGFPAELQPFLILYQIKKYANILFLSDIFVLRIIILYW